MLNSIRLSTRVAIASALGLPIAFWALGTQTMTALDNYRRAEVITIQNSAANALIAGVYEILIERQHVNNALQADNPATASDLTEIARYRNAARSKIGAAYADLAEARLPGKAAAISEFKTALEKAEDYRRKSDEAIKLPKAQRDPDVVKNSYPALSAFVTTGQSLWNKVLRNTSQLDTELGGSPISGSRLDHARHGGPRARNDFGGDVGEVRDSGRRAPHHPDDPRPGEPAVVAAAGQSRRAGSSGTGQGPGVDQGRLLRQIPAAGRPDAQSVGRGRQLSIALPAWVETTTPLLATILDVMQGANQASEARTAEFQSAATRELVISVGLLLLGVLLLAPRRPMPSSPSRGRCGR